MAEYFENFPVINYGGREVRDITRRNKFIKGLSNNPLIFLPYTVKEGERPEDIAYHYYGSTEYTSLIYLANNIVDPYHQWPFAEKDFENYIIKKYGEQSGNRIGYNVLDWTKNENIDDNIIYYYREV